MPDERTKAKLSGEQKLRVCSLLAMGYIPERICQTFFDEYDITISPQNIRQSYQKGAKWKKVIARMQREAVRVLLREPLAIKVNRIKFLTEAANEGMTWRLERINYDRKGNEVSRIEKRHIGVIPAIMNQIRIEIEGDRPLVDLSQHNHYVTVLHNIAKKEKDGQSNAAPFSRGGLNLIK